MYAGNPNAIPFQANLHDGTTQIADNGQVASVASKPLYVLFTGSRTAVDQWSMTPVTDDIALRLLRKAYRRAFGFPDTLYDDDCELANDLAHELKKSTVVVDDIRTTNQISARLETTRRLEEAEAADSQKSFVEALARYLGEEGQFRDRNGYRFAERDWEFERIATDFAKEIGNRNGDQIVVLGEQLLHRGNPAAPLVPQLAQQLSDAIRDAKNLPDEPMLKLRVYQEIELFLSRLGGIAGREPELMEAARQLFEVYRSWPEQSTLIGVRHREASAYRVDDHKVLTSNHPKIILPTEIAREGEDLKKKLHDGNLDYVDLGSEYTYLLTIDCQNPIVGPPKPSLRVQHRFNEDRSIAEFDISVWDHIEANDVQQQLDEKFPGRFIASGGPLSVSSPISISYVGESKEREGPPELHLFMPYPLDQLPPIRVESFHRYMKVTPLVAEVRRQVKDVEEDLEKIKGGWLHWSCDKREVPKHACYTAAWKDCGRTTYVWVSPENRKEFEEFTIKILNFSNLIKDVKLSGTSGVKYSPATSSPPLR